jgi:hypothetical protein
LSAIGDSSVTEDLSVTRDVSVTEDFSVIGDLSVRTNISAIVNRSGILHKTTASSVSVPPFGYLTLVWLPEANFARIYVLLDELLNYLV